MAQVYLIFQRILWALRYSDNTENWTPEENWYEKDDRLFMFGGMIYNPADYLIM